jgi:hypothetical protein
MEPNRQCTATKKNGTPCRNVAWEDGKCRVHLGLADMAELGRRRRSKRLSRMDDDIEAELTDFAFNGKSERVRTDALSELARSALSKEEPAAAFAPRTDAKEKLATLLRLHRPDPRDEQIVRLRAELEQAKEEARAFGAK